MYFAALYDYIIVEIIMDSLSKKDAALLSSLVNPDDHHYESQYVWDIQVQQQILGMLLKDRFFLIQAMDLIKPIYFTEGAHQKICNILFDYFNKYKNIPRKEYIIELIKENIDEDNPLYLYYTSELKSSYEAYHPGFDHKEFLLDKITEFAKVQATKEATSNMISILKKNQPDRWSLIRSLWEKALNVERNVDVGLDYFATFMERYERMEKNKGEERFITGFRSIDEALDGGLSRGEIGSFAGASGSGKSVCLTRAATFNLVKGKKILYVSLEMNEDKVARRFDSMLTKVGLNSLEEKKEEVFKSLKEKHEKLCDLYLDEDSDDDRFLIIKQFPASSSNTATLRAYMSQLQSYGYHPDMVIVDYVGEFRDYAGIPTHESRERHVRELRGFAMDYNVCVFTAMQLNRGAREAMEQEDTHPDDNNLADSSGQSRPLDALWMICQNEAQKKAGVGSIFVAKHRDGNSRFSIYFKQNKRTLVMGEIDKQTYGGHMSKLSERTSENIVINKLQKKKQQPNGEV